MPQTFQIFRQMEDILRVADFCSRTSTTMRKVGAPRPLHCISYITVYIYTYMYIYVCLDMKYHSHKRLYKLCKCADKLYATKTRQDKLQSICNVSFEYKFWQYAVHCTPSRMFLYTVSCTTMQSNGGSRRVSVY